jgi:hypothetical protein
VSSDKVFLDGTTMGEVLDTHRDTLVLALGVANREVEAWERQKFERGQEQLRQKQEHERQVRDAAERIKFD